jgi:hypothetical protein
MAFSQVNCFDNDPYTLRATVQCTAADDAVQLEVDTASAFNVDPRKGDIQYAKAASDYVVKVYVGGLDPDTTYYWRVYVNGVVQTPQTQVEGTGTSVVSIKTAPLPTETGTLKVAVGSDLLEGDHLVWQAIAGLAPSLYVNCGDNIDVDAQVGVPDEQADYYTAYNLLFDNSNFQEGRMQRNVGYRMPMKTNCDDHDYFDNYNAEDGAQKFRWGATAWRERWPVDESKLELPYGPRRTERFGKVEFFFCDGRQRNGNYVNYDRYPDAGADTTVIDTDSTRTIVYVSDNVGQAHYPKKGKGAYGGWYMRLSQAQYTRATVRPPRTDLWRRVIDSYVVDGDGTKVALVLHKALPDTFDPTVDKWLFMDNGSMWDCSDVSGVAPLQEDNGFDWLVDALNASTARWRIIVSPCVMNETLVADDNWRKWSALNGEIRTLYQCLDDGNNIVVVSGDLHRHSCDDGTNGEFPECVCGPTDQSGSTGGVSTWSNGQADRPTTNPDGSSNGFALFTITQGSIVVDWYWSNSGTASAMGGLTQLTVNYVEPTVEDYEMNTKRLTLSGAQTNAAVVTPAAGEKLIVKSIVATASNAASEMRISRGDASDTTMLAHEENATRVERHYDPLLRLEPDEAIKFTGGVAAEDTTFVVEYASRGS